VGQADLTLAATARVRAQMGELGTVRLSAEELLMALRAAVQGAVEEARLCPEPVASLTVRLAIEVAVGGQL
jgi:hypothetical protein